MFQIGELAKAKTKPTVAQVAISLSVGHEFLYCRLIQYGKHMIYKVFFRQQ